MIVSNRLLCAALSALASDLERQYGVAVEEGSLTRQAIADYSSRINSIRSQLKAYGEDLTLATARVLLPGEQS